MKIINRKVIQSVFAWFDLQKAIIKRCIRRQKDKALQVKMFKYFLFIFYYKYSYMKYKIKYKNQKHREFI